jgi:membrane-bound metal-dependent hydrolase YbcI (DUF457 family)
MKGFTHFISGVAAATFFPQAMELVQKEHSLIYLLGGIFGVMPDTLDFKLAKFLDKYDAQIDINPDKEINADEIAKKIGELMEQAYEKGQRKTIKLHTTMMGPDMWLKWSVRFDNENQLVKVKVYGPVSGSELLIQDDNYKLKGKLEGEYKVKYPILHTYDEETKMTIFTGPTLSFFPKDGKVEVEFLRWHRRWSHSLTFAALWGVIIYGIAVISGWTYPWLYGLITFSGGAVHILEDQTGFMGSNLFFPFTQERAVGMKWIRSGDALPNFFTVWLAVSIIIFNLNRFSLQKAFYLPWYLYFLYVDIIPWAVILISGKLLDKFSSSSFNSEPLLEKGVLDEMQAEETEE